MPARTTSSAALGGRGRDGRSKKRKQSRALRSIQEGAARAAEQPGDFDEDLSVDQAVLVLERISRSAAIEGCEKRHLRALSSISWGVRAAVDHSSGEEGGVNGGGRDHWGEGEGGGEGTHPTLADHVMFRVCVSGAPPSALAAIIHPWTTRVPLSKRTKNKFVWAWEEDRSRPTPQERETFKKLCKNGPLRGVHPWAFDFRAGLSPSDRLLSHVVEVGCPRDLETLLLACVSVGVALPTPPDIMERALAAWRGGRDPSGEFVRLLRRVDLFPVNCALESMCPPVDWRSVEIAARGGRAFEVFALVTGARVVEGEWLSLDRDAEVAEGVQVRLRQKEGGHEAAVCEAVWAATPAREGGTRKERGRAGKEKDWSIFVPIMHPALGNCPLSKGAFREMFRHGTGFDALEALKLAGRSAKDVGEAQETAPWSRRNARAAVLEAFEHGALPDLWRVFGAEFKPLSEAEVHHIVVRLQKSSRHERIFLHKQALELFDCGMDAIDGSTFDAVLSPNRIEGSVSMGREALFRFLCTGEYDSDVEVTTWHLPAEVCREKVWSFCGRCDAKKLFNSDRLTTVFSHPDATLLVRSLVGSPFARFLSEASVGIAFGNAVCETRLPESRFMETVARWRCLFHGGFNKTKVSGFAFARAMFRRGSSFDSREAVSMMRCIRAFTGNTEIIVRPPTAAVARALGVCPGAGSDLRLRECPICLEEVERTDPFSKPRDEQRNEIILCVSKEDEEAGEGHGRKHACACVSCARLMLQRGMVGPGGHLCKVCNRPHGKAVAAVIRSLKLAEEFV